jgi:hypothetical protein
MSQQGICFIVICEFFIYRIELKGAACPVRNITKMSKRSDLIKDSLVTQSP